jgi:hypothetical protein
VLVGSKKDKKGVYCLSRQGKVIYAIKGWLETASKQGIIKSNLNESEMLATVLLGMTDASYGF